mmetsp:Transcript_42607/g.83560  ORF Transcript_42607/g.83560 Transcript_42607/m.83560 type:complete len:150 (-) Transcript_42607:80-529(-)
MIRGYPPDHSFFADGNQVRELLAAELDENIGTTKTQVKETPQIIHWECDVAGCGQEFGTMTDYELHYKSCHSHVCSECGAISPTDHYLQIHFEETHDMFFKVLAEKQPMFSCLLEACDIKSWTQEDRRMHLIQHHSFPPDFEFPKHGQS